MGMIMHPNSWFTGCLIYQLACAAASGLHVVEFGLQRREVKQNSLQESSVATKIADSLKVHFSSGDDGVIPVTLENHEYYYQISLGLGTPSQKVNFTIDTGSSDLWVVDSSNPFCNYTGALSPSEEAIDCSGLTFKSAESSSFKNLSIPFEIQYGDWSAANGTLATDIIEVGMDDGSAPKISNATFAVAYSANSTNCVLGIGFDQNEALAKIHKNESAAYPLYFNVPSLMKRQGLIKSNAYSLYLNATSSDTGSILFGGVDHSKYYGQLAVMPMYNYYWKYLEQPTQMRVMLNGLDTNSPQGQQKSLASFNISVLLDSGTSFAYLPSPIVEGVAGRYGYVYSDDLGYWFGDCSVTTTLLSDLIFDFSGAKIAIPASDMLVSLKTDDQGGPFVLNGEPQCVLALNVAEDPYGYILGDVILRSMYAVYDLDNYEIGLAQSRITAADDPGDVEDIISGIPRASLVPGYTRTVTNDAISISGTSNLTTAWVMNVTASPPVATSSVAIP